jgi:hypothetical protein
MGLKGFERRLERLVEGVFARAFSSGLTPLELGRRLVRDMDDQRTVSVRGDMAAPNEFTFFLAGSDREQFAEVEEALTRDLADAAREHARDERYTFMGPVEVRFDVDPKLSTGGFRLQARFKEGPATGAAAQGRSCIVLPSGDRMTLGDVTLRIGRSPDSDVVLPDPNVSRRHAELRPDGGGWILRDLGSTNGTRVNGMLVNERRLAHGDEITVGAANLRFEAP